MIDFVLLLQRTEESCLRCETVEQGLKVNWYPSTLRNVFLLMCNYWVWEWGSNYYSVLAWVEFDW